MNNIDKYFDWAATSPGDDDILKSSLDLSLHFWANPSSTHTLGKNAKQLLEEARKSVSSALKVKPEQIFFTSGGTESDHIALLSVLDKPSKGTILFSSIEHPAIREQANLLKKQGYNVIAIPSDEFGIISPQAVTSLLTNDTLLVCIMAVNNETGVIQPIYEIADAIKNSTQGKRKPKFHVDCVQAAGKIPLDLSYDGIDTAAFSAHKICGPRGIGLLYVQNPQSFTSFLRGGGQEQGIRSGTENLYGAIAFSKCLERYYMDLKTQTNIKAFKEQKKNTLDLINKLSSLKGCTIIPKGRMQAPDKFSPFVLQVAFENIPGNVMLRALDAKGFCISTGSACSSKKANRPVLEAMHVDSKLRENSVRLSFGPHTTLQAMQDLFNAIKEINNTFNPS